MADSRSLPPADDVAEANEDYGINEEERAEIEREIDALVARSGRELRVAREHLQPRKSGVGLPLFIWLLSAAAIAAGFYLLTQYFEVREETIVLESRAYFTTEAQLIQEILRESEERLAEKDEEITDIQDRLAQLNAEKTSLEENLEEQVSRRAAELRAELEAELAAERERLAEAGRSETEIDERLAELEAERETEVEEQLETFRAQAEEEVAELQTQLEQQQAQLEQTLAASREERERLAEEAAEREAELRRQFTEELQALEESEQAALARIEELQALRERELLLTDRVLGSFAVIVQDIEQGMTDEALAGLESLERLLLDESAAAGSLGQQRRTELALVSTLRSLVRDVDVLRRNIAVRDLTTTEAETAQLEQERAAELIETARNTVALAEEARTAGRFSEARSLYQQALATIPSLEQVYPGILDLESTRRRIALETAVSEAETLLAEGETRAAVDRYLGSLETLAADEDDPLLEVAAGIDVAVARATEQLQAAQESLDAEYREQLAAQSRSVTQLNRDLSAAQNALATAQATTDSLRAQLAGLQTELEAERTLSSDRGTALATLRRRISDLEGEIAGAETELAAAEGRSESLETTLTDAQARVGELEAANGRLQRQLAEATSARDRLQSRIDSLEEELAARPEPADETAVPRATQEQLEELRQTVTAREESIAGLERELGEARDELAQSRSTVDELRADLEETEAQVSGLQEQVAELRERREATSGEAEELQEELETARRRVAELEGLESDVSRLASLYEEAVARAQNRLQAGNYALARNAILDPFDSTQGRELFPGFLSTLSTAHDRLVDEAEATTTQDARASTLEDVVALATEVQQNIDGPREAVSVQTYLRRQPELREVASELFELVELSRRSISAPEIEYRLLGSVSRVTGNLVVVERLVALEPEVGDGVEIRRAPTLGQEVPIALGTILEVTNRRVVVSVDEIYELAQSPATRDLVYIAVE
ncbi:MAG: hypothetical protein ACOC3H_03000 [bacterium]